MDIVIALRIAVLVIGVAMAGYGSYVLATGRLPERSRGSFRSVRDAGMNALLTGLGLVFLALGQFALDAESLPLVFTFAATILAVVFMGVGFFRYRPRRFR
jgi:hypothetical protein